MRSRLPPLTKDEFKQLHDKLVEAGQVLASEQYKLPHKSVRELVNNIRKEQHS
jgi:hypothetical protein